jgi:DNA-binding transcriptional ArsR family regulator
MAIEAHQIETVARFLSVLGEASRLRIISALMTEPLTVGEIVSNTGFKQANVSKQLAILFDAGLVSRQREGVSIRYQIAVPLLYELCALVCDSTRHVAIQRFATFENSSEPAKEKADKDI